MSMMMVMLFPLVVRAWTERNKWDKLDYDALEKAWEEGDDEELLLTDHQLKQKKLEEERKNAPPFNPK